MNVPRLGGGQEGLRITQSERRCGDDCRSPRSRIFCPWFDFGRDIGGVRNVHRTEVKTNKRKGYTMKNKLTKNEIEVLRKIRNRGFAVVIFTPAEIGNEVGQDDLEDILTERGFRYIADGR